MAACKGINVGGLPECCLDSILCDVVVVCYIYVVNSIGAPRVSKETKTLHLHFPNWVQILDTAGWWRSYLYDSMLCSLNRSTRYRWD